MTTNGHHMEIGRGRPVGIWRRTVEAETMVAGKILKELGLLDQDRAGWRFVGYLYSSGSEEK